MAEAYRRRGPGGNGAIDPRGIVAGVDRPDATAGATVAAARRALSILDGPP